MDIGDVVNKKPTKSRANIEIRASASPNTVNQQPIKTEIK